MEEGFTFVALFALSLMAMGWIALILFGLHQVGKHFGCKRPSFRMPWLPTVLICAAGCAASCLVLLIPADRLTRFCLGLMIWLTVVHPLLVGYWFARSKLRRDRASEMWRRTEKWLSYWENRRDSHR